MQWVLVLLIFGMEPGGPAVGMTSISGFMSFESCIATGAAWEKTKKEYERTFECLPANASK